MSTQGTTLPPPPGQERAAFEAFCFERGLMSASHGLLSVSSHCDTAWLAWQARAAIAAQAPTALMPSKDASDAFNEYRDRMRKIGEPSEFQFWTAGAEWQAQQAQGVPPDRVFQLADAHAEESYENGDRRFDRGGLIQFAKELLAAAPQAEPVQQASDVQRAQIIAKTAQSFKDDATHLGQLVYVNDLVWALGVLAAAPQAEPALDKTRDHLSTMIGLVLGARQRGAAYEAGSAIDKAVQEAIEHLKDWPQAPAVEAEPQPEREPIPAMTWDQFKAASRVEFSEYGEDDTMDTATPDEIETAVRIVRLVERHHGIGTKGGKP